MRKKFDTNHRFVVNSPRFILPDIVSRNVSSGLKICLQRKKKENIYGIKSCKFLTKF